LLDQCFRLGEQSDALTGVAFAAEIVGEALAVGRLGKHARQGKLADAARSGEKEGVRNVLGAQGAAKGSHNPRVAKKFREGHALRPALSGIARHGHPQHLLDRGQDLACYFLHGMHGSASGIEAFDGYPRRVAGELIVHRGRVLQVA
jgi:hypothetical protein